MKEIITDVDALRQVSTEAKVERGVATQETLDIIQELVESIPPSNEALGLSAPQIGIFKKVFLARIQNSMFAFVNPQVGASLESFSSTEGCLSLPGIERTVCRQKEVYVRASVIYEIKNGCFDNDTIYTYETTWDLDGVDASVIQHEDDHLDGTLIIDLEDLSPPKLVEPSFTRIPEKSLKKMQKRTSKIHTSRQQKRLRNKIPVIQKMNPKRKAKADKLRKAFQRRTKKRVQRQEEILTLQKDTEDE